MVGLDILPTVIGLSHDTSGIHPLTLIRGVIGEFAERAEHLAKGASTGQGLNFLRRRKLEERAEEVRDVLDQLCASIDLERPELREVRQRLKMDKRNRRNLTVRRTLPVLSSPSLFVPLSRGIAR